MAGTWADEHFDFDDVLNAAIWAESRARGARLTATTGRASAGGWQDRWAAPPLPWVPDLVGRRWRERGGVVVIGSAYAPFVGGSASRHAAMPLSSYTTARSAAEFGPRFLASVVRPDSSFYGGIGQLLEGLVEPERVVLTDLCRASFVEQRPDGFFGGDDVVRRHATVYDQWVDAGADWTLRRVGESGAKVIVVLGDLAWTTFQRVARKGGAPVSDRGWSAFSVAHPATAAAVVTLGGTERNVLRVAHPSWRNKNDTGYAGARRALALLLGVRAPTAPATPRLVRPPPASPTRTTAPAARGTVIGLHFVCRGGMNVRDLPDGTFETGVWVVADQHARTAEYVALHESKSERSYRQGRVLGFRAVDHEGRRRLVFRVAPDPKRLDWVGEGSGEKGYRYR